VATAAWITIWPRWGQSPYLIGFDNSRLPLADGSEFLVPQGTT